MATLALKRQIEAAFAATPPPARDFPGISASLDDEGIVAYFRDTTWRDHAVADLRRHAAALSFFTDAAFRYWLPAFLLAELDSPQQADIIAESIAYALGKSKTADARLRALSRPELEAILAFFDHCSARLGRSTFRVATTAVRDRLALLR